jgi:hypothetical protein
MAHVGGFASRSDVMARHQRSWSRDAAFFVALLATALALGAALAHALELPNKIGMSREAYFVVQNIYRGWNRLGYLLAVELVGMLAVVILYRRERRVMWPALVAVGCLITSQVVFWTLTFPANAATSNWTIQPANWEILRQQWEYSHLAGAVMQTLAMAALIVAVLARDRNR